MISFSTFEFSHAGQVSVAVSSVGISSIPVTSNLSEPDPSRIGFVFLSHELSYGYDYKFKRNPDLCPFDSKSISVLFTFQDLTPPPQSSFNKSYNVTYPGEYSLYFANCNDLSLVTMDVRTELYNIDDDGTTKDYLSAGQPQPSFYLEFLLISVWLLVCWIFLSLKNHHCLEIIHLLMGVLLVMNIFHFICAMADQNDLKVTGTYHGWHILFYISRFMRDMHFFTVIMLIGAGWCNWRRFLPDWVIINMTIVILLEVWANVSLVAVGKSGPYSEEWPDLRARFTIIDIICCLVVFFHTFCSAASFKEATDTSIFLRSYSSLKETTCRHDVFPFLVLAYIMFTRGLNVVLDTTALQETSNLVFSVAMFYMYRPFALDDEDQKRAGFLDHTGV